MTSDSGITPETLKTALIDRLEVTHVEIEDLSGGCGQAFEAKIVSEKFMKTTLARHRLVNSALKDEIAAIHAWTAKCHTPEEWEKKKDKLERGYIGFKSNRGLYRFHHKGK